MASRDDISKALRSGLAVEGCRAWILGFLRLPKPRSDGEPSNLVKVLRQKTFDILAEGPARAMARFIEARRKTARPTSEAWMFSNVLRIPRNWPPSTESGTPITADHPTHAGMLLCCEVARRAAYRASEANVTVGGRPQIRRELVTLFSMLRSEFEHGAKVEEKLSGSTASRLDAEELGEMDTDDFEMDDIVQSFMSMELLGIDADAAPKNLREQVHSVLTEAGDGHRSLLAAAVTGERDPD